MQVHYRVVPGLTFEMCQSGCLTPEVKAEFVAAIRWLDDVKHVHAITGDCALRNVHIPLLIYHHARSTCMNMCAS
jgi:hypothetical protein